MKNILVKTVFTILAGMCFLACEDDELRSKELVVFFRNWKVNEVIAINKSYKSNGEMVLTGIDEIKFPLYVSREVTASVSAEISVDEEMLTAYNEQNETDYILYPADMITIESKGVEIPAGKLQSSDSIRIKFDIENLIPGNYLLPIKITNVLSSDKGVQPSVTAGTTYYRIEKTFRNINNTNLYPTEASKINRSKWKVTCDDEPEQDSPVSNLFDGDRETFWSGTSGVKSNIVVDMGEVHTLKGLTFYYSGSYLYSPAYMEVYSSMDNNTWVYYGTAGWFNFFSESDKESGINFFEPVPCRYFKVQPRGMYSRYAVKFAELDAVK